jgi:LAO/AO transport system kinase
LLKTRIKERAPHNTITCPSLRKIAEEFGVSYKKAGKAADELKVKIKNCDLGCF